MRLISYQEPTIIEEDDKPIAIENKTYAYNSLAPRRFEELVYSIFKQEIEFGFITEFNSISLMSGVRDHGRDCALFRNGKAYGNIQCKNTGKSLSKDEFGFEITKFALYSILYPELIYSINDFTYYIAVSTGLVGTCSDFIDDFNNKIIHDSNITKWIHANTLKPTLNSFQLKDPTDNILNIFSKIKIKKVTSQDIDILLSKKENQALRSLFFQVRTVTDNSRIEHLEEKVDRYFNKILDDQELISQLSRGSVGVTSQRNEFEGIQNSHISRSETEELFNWVIAPLHKNQLGKEENICLLAGNAGMGKTVIIKDLYEKLFKQNIPVLALKADKLYASSLTQLQEKINLSIPIIDFIEQCKQRFSRLIILVDQIDALSQSLSSDRSFLYTYTQLIETYKHDSVVRIIISVRIFDLLYDPSLKVYKHIKTIEVKKLDEDVVLIELKKIGLDRNNISNNLLALLRTPNNLDVFSRIYNNEGSFAGINTIQDLYAELWKYKILNIEISLTDSRKLTELLYRISDRMFELQQITVNELFFENYVKELNYLTSEQLLKIDNKEIQFFHQSFYDYVFAKKFVENKKSIEELIEKENQSLMIRSSLKMILNYLRLYDSQLYIKQFENILKSNSILFHLIHLLISTLATLENPSREEKNLFINHILTNQDFASVFFEYVIGNKWITFLIDKNVLNILIEPKTDDLKTQQEDYNRKSNRCLQLLRRNLDNCQDAILSFLKNIEDVVFIYNILYFLKSWNNHLAFELLDKCITAVDKKAHDYYHILEQAADFNPEYVFNKTKTTSLSYYHKSDSQTEYYESRIVKKLFEKIPHLVSDFLIKDLLLTTHTKYATENNSVINSDYDVDHFDFRDKDEYHKDGYLLKALADYLRRQAKERTDFFKDFITDSIKSRHLKAFRFLVYALNTNEENYVLEIFSLIIYLFENNYYTQSGSLNYEIRNLLRASYHYFNYDQQTRIVTEIRNINVQNEMYCYTDNTGKKHFYSSYGLTKFHFLNTIPKEVIVKDKQLNQEFQVLGRRFKNSIDKYKNVSSGGAVRAPLSIIAHEKMNKQQWITSFKKYNTEHRPWNYVHEEDFLKGGLHQHREAFKEAVKKSPSKYIELIEETISNKDVPIEYPISGIQGILESKTLLDKAFLLFKKIIKKNPTNSHIHYCIWIADDFIIHDLYDQEILDFVIYEALNNSNPEKEKIVETEKKKNKFNSDLISSGINSVRGLASRALTNVTNINYKDEVFTTLEKVLNEDFNLVRASVIEHFAYLMNLDKQRTFDLFLQTMYSEKNEEILPYGIWTSKYLIHYDFTKMIPYFEKLETLHHLSDDQNRNICSTLFIAWLYDYPKAELLFKQFLKSHIGVIPAAIRIAVDNFYFKSNLCEKSKEVIELSLNFQEKKIAKEFEIEFLHLDHIKFEDIYEILVKYVQSKVFIISNYFLEYLTFHSNQNVYKCIYLFELAIKSENLVEANEGLFLRHEDNATKFIIGAYTRLAAEDSSQSLQSQMKLLILFDIILKDDRFKNNVEMVLEKIIE